jgi:DNA-directed RNA polymerase subunit alpha
MKKPVHRVRRKAKPDPLSLAVEDLNLSIRLLNCLKHDDIKHLGDITRRTATDLARLPKFGTGCLRETIRVLRRYGLSLEMNNAVRRALKNGKVYSLGNQVGS